MYYASHTKNKTKKHVTNEGVCAKIQQAIGPHKDLLTIVGSLCQEPAGNRTTRRPPDYRKETQTTVIWSCLPFVRSGQNHFARHSERGKKTRRTKEEVGRQHQGMDAWSSASPRGQWRTEENGENWLQNHLWCPNDPCG